MVVKPLLNIVIQAGGPEMMRVDAIDVMAFGMDDAPRLAVLICNREIEAARGYKAHAVEFFERVNVFIERIAKLLNRNCAERLVIDQKNVVGFFPVFACH